MLSKSGDIYPKEGDVRVIAILPAITKLYEQVLLNRLRQEMESNPLHPNQRGFVIGGST